MAGASGKIPVILDTDIGGDIDDTWALVMLLNSPEFDIKLILTEEGNTLYRAKITARMLEIAGRTDIPIGIGLATSEEIGFQGAWIDSFDMDRYAGVVYEDGVDAMIDCVMRSAEETTIIAIGPPGNLAAALQRQPEIAKKSRIVGMYGSVRKGYFGSDTPDAEYNVAVHPDFCRKVFTAGWEITLSPLDTCGMLILKGDLYQKVLHSPKPLARALMENYRLWLDARKNTDETRTDIYPGIYFEQSTLLCDTAAVYLAFSEELATIEDLGITVTDDGCTRIDPQAKRIRCATSWKDLAAFEEILVQRLIR
ncbi:MAG: nucleoside hydrolase [Clostridiaceae bacterium]|nr:nucleoside hydrolase [Clostridiaceae bacterium]